MFDGIKKFIERGRKGYCYEDLWSWEYFFSGLVAKSLREFKEKTITYPSQDITWDEWMAILDEMIECFDEQTRGVENLSNDGKYDHELYEKRLAHKAERLHRGFELLEANYYSLWD